MLATFKRYRAAIEFKSAGATTKITNLLMSLDLCDLDHLRSLPWLNAPHVRGLELQLLATAGCGPSTLEQIKNIYDHGHVRGGPSGARHSRAYVDVPLVIPAHPSG